MKRTLAMITAGLMMAALSAPITPASADNSYDLTVTVDTTGYRKPISPYIYGINYIRRGEAPNVTTFSARQGGNRHSAYNWENNASSAGADYKHYSDAYLVNFDKASLAIPGANALEFAEDMAAQNTDYKITTVQMAGYAAADMDGEVTADEIAPSARWIPVYPQKNAPFSMTPDTTDNAVYMDEYVNYLVTKLGDSATKTGIQAYSLDNEPTLWSSTHARMHLVQTTCEEIVSKSIEYASAINLLIRVQMFTAVYCTASMHTSRSVMHLTGRRSAQAITGSSPIISIRWQRRNRRTESDLWMCSICIITPRQRELTV